MLDRSDTGGVRVDASAEGAQKYTSLSIMTSSSLQGPLFSYSEHQGGTIQSTELLREAVMPAATRSRTKQAHIEDFSKRPQQQSERKKSTKRKVQAEQTEKDVPTKKQRVKGETEGETPRSSSSPDESKPASGKDGVILINRAPVLELWAACVAHVLYPSTSWNTCLSVGSAISTLCAISKGRAIGQIEKPDSETAERRKQERRKTAEKEDLDEMEVMGFTISIKNGSALVSGKPKYANEVALRKKFGDANYDRTRSTFDEALRKWNDDREALNSKAFRFYERFRPSVAAGQRGWGRKGELSMSTITDTIGAPG